MLDSIKAINLVSAYSAKEFKKDRSLSEVKELFKSKVIEDNENDKKIIKRKTDTLEISQEALDLFYSNRLK